MIYQSLAKQFNQRLPRILIKTMTVLALGFSCYVAIAIVSPKQTEAAWPAGFNPSAYTKFCRNGSFTWGVGLNYTRMRYTSPSMPVSEYQHSIWSSPSAGTGWFDSPYQGTGTDDKGVPNKSLYLSYGPYSLTGYITPMQSNLTTTNGEERLISTINVAACADIRADYILTSKKIYLSGETVSATLKLTNTSSTAIEATPGVSALLGYGNGGTVTINDTAGFAAISNRTYVRTWATPAPGSYRTRVETNDVYYQFVDPDPAKPSSLQQAEQNTVNNDLDGDYYAVIVRPTGLSSAAYGTTCSERRLTWTAGQGITNYQLQVYDSANTLIKDLSIPGNSVSAILTDLDTDGTYRYTLTPRVVLGGVTYSDAVINGPSFTIARCIDLLTADYSLANSAGTIQRIFAVGEAIYFKTTAQNNSGVSTPSGAITRFYKDNNLYYPNYPDSTITHGAFGANGSYVYESWPGGNYDFTYSNKSVTWYGVGKFRAMQIINKEQDAGPVKENNYGNNIRDYYYAVIEKPTNPTTAPSCNSVVFNWDGGAGIDSYRINIKNLTTNGTPQDYTGIPGTANSYPKNLSEGPNNYQWKLYPQVNINGTLYEDATVPTATFSTKACLHFEITPPALTYIQPNIATPVSMSIDYGPSPSSLAEWNNQGAKLKVGILGVVSGQVCSAGMTNPSAYSGTVQPNASWPANSAKMNNGTISQIYSAGNQVTLTLTTPLTGVTPGSYFTVCLGALAGESPAISPDTQIVPVIFRISVNPWLQVKSSSPSLSSQTGDVHSNGGISINIPGSRYFFNHFAADELGGTEAVLSAVNGVSFGASQQASTTPKKWRSASNPIIASPTYESMMAITENNLGQITQISNLNDPYPAAGSLGKHMVDHCNSNTNEILNITGNLNPNSVINLSNIVGGFACANTQLVYFVDGDMNVSQNIIDGTNTATMTFIIQGNLNVNPSVGQLDGVYMVGGTIDDKAGNVQLVVRGSLLGMGGNLPTTTTGRISSGLSRTLDANNLTTPAEVIMYQPKYMYLLKELLGSTNVRWQEGN